MADASQDEMDFNFNAPLCLNTDDSGNDVGESDDEFFGESTIAFISTAKLGLPPLNPK